MGLVLWIDQNTFATSLLEKVFKSKDIALYTISDAGEFVYLIEDLKPKLIVLDSKTAEASLDAVKTQYKSSESFRSTPVIVIDNTENLAFISNQIGEIKRPIDPFEIPQILEDIQKTQ